MRTRPILFICFLVVWDLIARGQAPPAPSPTSKSTSSRSSIPYVPTRHDTVKDLLWLAEVGTNDVVYDLGSGDGRVAIAAVRDFGARKAVGIEINPALVEESRQNAAKAGVAERVQFIHGDLFTNDFSEAAVVILYLGPGANLDLREKLIRCLKPGSRIVSHQFGMGEWTPDKTLDVRTALLGMYGEFFNSFASNPDVPDFATPFLHKNHDVLSEWIVPAPVAGTWRGNLSGASPAGDLTLTLHQRLSGLSGSFQFQSGTNIAGTIEADLWGTNLRLHCIPTNRVAYGAFLMWFDGHATNDTLRGKVWISQKTNTSACDWTARRDKSDFSGDWQWSGPKDSPVQLKIERQGGGVDVTYEDKNRDIPAYSNERKPIPVTDFYDFGGGFYFTLVLGRESNGARRMGPDDGWVIGEATMISNALSGTIAFYPHPQDSFGHFPGPAKTNTEPPPPEKPLKTGKREWQPVRVP